MSGSWELDQPGRFTVGAIGEPGARVFYFQAFGESAGEPVEVAVKCEKQQAQALSEHLVKLLADLPAADPGTDTPAAEALPPTDLSWVVGSISIGVDRARERIVVLLEELEIEEADTPAPTDPGRLRVSLSAGQVRALAAQVEALVEGGRPLCRLCEQPIDPSGHACPRLN